VNDKYYKESFFATCKERKYNVSNIVGAPTAGLGGEKVGDVWAGWHGASVNRGQMIIMTADTIVRTSNDNQMGA